jgi:hypothetical protein
MIIDLENFHSCFLKMPLPIEYSEIISNPQKPTVSILTRLKLDDLIPALNLDDTTELISYLKILQQLLITERRVQKEQQETRQAVLNHEFHCRLCDHSYVSEKALSAHLKTRKHEKAKVSCFLPWQHKFD